MKDLQKLHHDLGNMLYDIQDNYKSTLKDKFEILGEFAESGLKDALEIIDNALDRIQELEDELEEAQEKIEELEREQDGN